jgi:WD40 repeat protein
MIETLTGSGAGPIAGYIAFGRSDPRYINVYGYRKNFLLPSLLGSQPTDATQDIYSVAFSGNADALAVSSGNTSAGLRFFTRSGSTFTSQSVPSNISTNTGSAAISSDGNYVAAAGGSTGRIWHNASGTLTNLTSVGSFTSSTEVCAVSSDGSYVAFLAGSSPTFLRIKERSGSGNSATYADMTLASQPSSGTGALANGGLAFSPDDVYLAVSPATQANQAIYKFNSGTSVYEKLASPFSGALPDNLVYGCSFSAQGDFLAISTDSKTFFYERSGDTFTSVANIASGRIGNFHPSGNWYITGVGAIYKKNSASSWTLAKSALQTDGRAAAFSPNI